MQPSNVDYRLRRVSEMAKYINAKAPDQRQDYVRQILRPMLPHVECPVLRKAMTRLAARYATAEGPRAA